LRVAVATKLFREDLFFRLAVLPLRIPPLRERLSDVPLLAHYFLERAAADQNKRPPTFAPSALVAMQAYHWPGNVRELGNCVERAVILAETGIIQASHLSLTPPEPAVSAPTYEFSGIDLAGTMDQALRRVLREVERRKIEIALAECNGDPILAARALRIPSRLLTRKMEIYELSAVKN
jgi:DNA-binding NtrC family response regulator